MGLNITLSIVRLLALLPALVVHEFAHGYSAYLLGDPTPKLQGRLTLNPLAHLDPMGTLMIIFAPIGWAKPVQVNPLNFRDPAKGMAISTACGPLSNIAQGIFWSVVLRIYLVSTSPSAADGNILVAFVAMAALINFVLAFFNLIPLGPLDGHHLMEYYLPYPQKMEYTRFNRQFGTLILFGLIMFSFMGGPNLLGMLVLRPALWLGGLIAGQDLYRTVWRGLA